MWKILTAMAAVLWAVMCPAAVVFEQPANPGGGTHKSAWYSPDGLDGDEYAYDNFSLVANAAISEIRWKGGYTNYLSGAGRAPVSSFTISIYRSIAGNSQPDLGTGGRLARYTVSGNAGETPSGTYGGVQMYDYAYTLQSPFQAVAGTTYWLQIEATQGLTPTYNWPPDWSFCKASGGDGHYFRRITGGPTQLLASDLTFSLLTAGSPTVMIAASATPAGSGAISGTGSYPINSTAAVTATANAGWGFSNWTENSTVVSTSSRYAFTATADRTLVAHFIPAYTITTQAFPDFAGQTSGDGVFNSGSGVTVRATPLFGYVFSEWTEYGGTVSTQPTYTFQAGADRALVANFVPDPRSVSFSFDDARPHSPFPVDLSSSGLNVLFSGTGQGFSIQPVGSAGLAPAGFSGLMVFPNSVFAADLIADFSESVTYFSIMYSPQELGCDTSATMRATAFLDNEQVGTQTATAPVPGTYPTGTLSISVEGGFNRVVVHYDARPATCQDWGPIFLADNVTVMKACGGSGILLNPSDVTVCDSGAASFSVTPSGPGPFSYQWRYGGVDIRDGAGGAGGSGVVSGAHAASLTIAPAAGGSLSAADAGVYDCVVSASGGCRLVSLGATLAVETSPVIVGDPASVAACPGSFASFSVLVAEPAGVLYQWNHDGVPIDPAANPTAASADFTIAGVGSGDVGSYDCDVSGGCGAARSAAAVLSVCLGDFNCDGGVDGADVEAFFLTWETGDSVADLNGDGGVDGADVEAFFGHWESGC